MKYYRLRQVSEILGGTPRPKTLRAWCQANLIPHSMLPTGTVYLMSEEQLAEFREVMEGGHAQAEKAKPSDLA